MYVKYFKRIIDIIFSLLGLPIFLLISCVVIPLILIDDGFPIFYNADRIGKNGILFKMYKFRSMKKNAPDIRMDDGSTYNAEDDPRVTRIGRLLRKTSIDEIPQLLNVLFGDMSIVGPRPFVPIKGVCNNDEDFLTRLIVKPGITGYTQAYFRNSINQSEKIKFDAEYAKSVSFMMDVKIFFKTIVTVILRKNIYNGK